jgi:1-deoxy-D-xylulose-5-phosphate synthase
MMEAIPDRAFDVGIAEQHAVTFSAGMATRGEVVYCNIYSTFMQRAYDQVVHDVCIQELPVIFCLDRAGLVGADGPTHHGVYDIAFMRCIPNMVVASPMNEQELRNMMYTAQLESFQSGTKAFTIRYPRGNGVMPQWKTAFEEITIGKGRLVKKGSDIAILSFGPLGNFAQQACDLLEKQGISPGLYDMRFAKPLDEPLLHEIFSVFDKVVTVEDGCLQGGFGSAVVEFMIDNNYSSQIKRLGIPDNIVEHGEPNELYQECGLDTAGIVNSVTELMSTKVNKPVLY